ncbi:uncharacterized protein ATNIH1004_010672 [Aspergillus tanneri]|uniref:Uncharacterized protein n=1 Tax=Aspergillus tanneri TaxID=1220188 RepID=A0A5M9M9Y9_9EURO|nr:uncharacterized protein ATNIH1004_010672 [Aspergillus tanneri]KAA8641733.1 hypothetical protein ATNIH1004_010672 [Aspergillus tanneri]
MPLRTNRSLSGIASYKCWQEKLGYNGADADGWPGKKSWNLLRVPLTGEEDVNNDIAVSFWVKAFIPLNVDKVTRPYPKDSNRTMIDGIPITGDCFLTDQRGFSNASGASSRMQSQVWVWVRPNGYRWSQRRYCDETIEVDCEDGDQGVLEFKAARNNPLVTGSPDIDLRGTLTVDREHKFVEFIGTVDDFPAFESYVSVNKRLFMYSRSTWTKKGGWARLAVWRCK